MPSPRRQLMQAVLTQVGPDKHQAIFVQAQVEAARAVLGGPASAQGEDGEDSVSKG